ncbi:hypothetical protein F6U93_07190 [Tamlana haliotis]|uniref:Uncharacterized protein n=1 Tax=Pseudotamlana haliotis TaxID=2614804 RepID=A0A6N6MEU7_9FLAO|nr:hypothetical protein [Tamlana haliotis]KAB1068269.1 hypothetical protein F6U93_07190 [Tamlana haliotis]
MDANTVHTIFKALPTEEQIRLYTLISKDVAPIQNKKKPRRTKPKIISDEACRNHLLESLFNVKLKKS